jgi:hypothetical protein
MNWILTLFITLLGLFVLDRLGLWMESRGWVYWRKKKHGSDGIGNALQELNSLMTPSIRHVIEHREKDLKQRDDQGDDPDQ